MFEMNRIQTIRTDTWTLSIPEDWIDKGQTLDGALYFESGDGTKGIYISTWKLGDLAQRPSAEVAITFKKSHLKSLRDMDGYSWSIACDEVNQVGSVAIAITDCVDKSQSYRIASKFLANPPTIVRATFHDYDCQDGNLSEQQFAPIIDSLSFCESTI